MLTGSVITIVPMFYDYSKTDMGDFIELVKIIVEKQAGIVFYHRQHQENSIRILIKLSHEGSFEHCIWKPIYPATCLSVPPMQDLLSEDEEMRKMLLDTKLKLLCWMVMERIPLEVIKSIDVKFVAIFLTINRLVDFGCLTKDEGDLLLFTTYRITNKLIKLNSNYPPRVNARGVRVAFIFQRFHNHITRCLKISGMPSAYRVSLMGTIRPLEFKLVINN
jgi:hypothetical protein